MRDQHFWESDCISFKCPVCCLNVKCWTTNLVVDIWMILPEVCLLKRLRKVKVWLRSSGLLMAVENISNYRNHCLPVQQWSSSTNHSSRCLRYCSTGRWNHDTWNKWFDALYCILLWPGGYSVVVSFAQQPVWSVSLTPIHQRRHFLWCWEHQNWTDNQWGWILFIFDRADLVWVAIMDTHTSEERGEHAITPSKSLKRTSLEIAEFSFGEVRRLVWVPSSIPSEFKYGAHYCVDILLPYVCLRGTMGPQFLFIDDNASTSLYSCFSRVRILNAWIVRQGLWI